MQLFVPRMQSQQDSVPENFLSIYVVSMEYDKIFQVWIL